MFLSRPDIARSARRDCFHHFMPVTCPVTVDYGDDENDDERELYPPSRVMCARGFTPLGKLRQLEIVSSLYMSGCYDLSGIFYLSYKLYTCPTPSQCTISTQHRPTRGKESDEPLLLASDTGRRGQPDPGRTLIAPTALGGFTWFIVSRSPQSNTHPGDILFARFSAFGGRQGRNRKKIFTLIEA